MAAEEDGAAVNKLHIAMFPWLAFGHMLPYLELSKLIAGKGHRVSFLSTPRSLRRLLPHLPPQFAPLITFVELPLPRLDVGLGIDEHAEATIDVPHDKVKFLKKAFDGLQQPVSHFLQSRSPDWLLFDFSPFWLSPVAAGLGIPTAFFSVFVEAQLCFFPPTAPGALADDRTAPEHYTVAPKWVPFPSTLAPRLFEIARLFDNITGGGGDEANISDIVRFLGSIRGCDMLAVRSCAEFEPEWLRLLEDLHGKPVIPVGQLPHSAATGIDSDWPAQGMARREGFGIGGVRGVRERGETESG